MITLTKYHQLNLIDTVWEPKYSTREVYVACHKVNRSRLDIKLRFSQVGGTSEYAGDWFITRKAAKGCHKKFDNNGMECYAIPWEKFERVELVDGKEFELW